MADRFGSFVKGQGSLSELQAKLQHKGSKFIDNNASVDAPKDLEILSKALEKSKSRCINKICLRFESCWRS